MIWTEESSVLEKIPLFYEKTTKPWYRNRCRWFQGLSSKLRTVQEFQFQVLDTVLGAQWQVMDTPTISVTSCGHSLNSSVTSYGHSPWVSVTLIARILKKKLKMRIKMIFFTTFTMLIVILRVFWVIYVKMGLYVTVPLRLRNVSTAQTPLSVSHPTYTLGRGGDQKLSQTTFKAEHFQFNSCCNCCHFLPYE